MSKRARYSVSVGGVDVSSRLSPFLISLSVNLSVGTHSDTAQIELDDTDGRVLMPKVKAPCRIALGWADGGATVSFEGTVDSVRSSGGGSGRTLSVSATASDMREKAKEPQSRHFDDTTIKDALTQVARTAGIPNVEIDPALASITREYIGLQDESLIGFGERIAREIGASFRIVGNRVVMTSRKGSFTGIVRATWGDNLHSWGITPDQGRPALAKAGARFYDWLQADWGLEEVATELAEAPARAVSRFLRANPQEAVEQADADAATSDRERGGGTVTIEGDPAAQPDQLCFVSGARPGVDGLYRIETVNHKIGAQGFVTTLTLKRPGDGSKPTDYRGDSAASEESDAPLDQGVIGDLAAEFRASQEGSG